MEFNDLYSINKTVFEVCHFTETDDLDDVAYWRSKKPIERFMGLEALRQSFYDYDPDTERLSGFFEVVKPT